MSKLMTLIVLECGVIYCNEIAFQNGEDKKKNIFFRNGRVFWELKREDLSGEVPWNRGPSAGMLA